MRRVFILTRKVSNNWLRYVCQLVETFDFYIASKVANSGLILIKLQTKALDR
jgi:hypothetical protein